MKLNFNPNSVYLLSPSGYWESVIRTTYITTIEQAIEVVKIHVKSLGDIFSHIEVTSDGSFNVFYWTFEGDTDPPESEIWYLFELVPPK